VKVHNYILNLQIESRTLAEICFNQIIPAAIAYQNELLINIERLKNLDFSDVHTASQMDIIKRISENLLGMKSSIEKMREERIMANAKDASIDMAKAYCHNVKPHMDKIRLHADRLEYLIDDKLWPLVKYRELMFIR
jgi:glutamine synthetase